jgi:hypothetical protein
MYSLYSNRLNFQVIHKRYDECGLWILFSAAELCQLLECWLKKLLKSLKKSAAKNCKIKNLPLKIKN